MDIIEGIVDEQKWIDFLSARSDSTIYHTPGWSRFLAHTLEIEPCHVFILNDSGDIIGFLPLFKIPNLRHKRELCSIPFAHSASYIGEMDQKDLAIQTAMEISTRQTGGHIILKDRIVHPHLHNSNEFCAHELDLSISKEEVWNKLDKGSVRWAVKKSEKLGVRVRQSNEPSDIDEFYRLNCLTKKALGVPSHPPRFFKNLINEFPNNLRLYVSELEGEIIGGGLMEFYGGRVVYGYGCADPNKLQMHPYNAFLWKCIEDACLLGYHTFDFGRTSKHNSGLMNFKRKWGTREFDLVYSSDRNNPSTFDRSSKMIKMGNIVIKKMPMNTYRLFSDFIFDFLGE